MKPDNNRPMSLVSILALVTMMLAFVGILFPAILRARTMARTTNCANNLKQIALAVHNYHDTYKSFPYGAGGTDGNGVPEQGNDYRLSGFVAILPFMDQMPLYDKIRKPYQSFPAQGPIPSYDPSLYPFWAHQVEAYVCPEEDVAPTDFAIRSYVFSYGDSIEQVGEFLDRRTDRATMMKRSRGAFARGYTMKLRDILDGTSNTIMCSETAIGIGDSLAKANVARDIPGIASSPGKILGLANLSDGKQYNQGVPIWDEGKGSNSADGTFRITGFNTVLPPNSPSATSANDPTTAVMSASSHHLGGAHVAICDGSIRYVFDSIDTGDLSKPATGQGESPYGVWGALGTRAGSELIPPAAKGSFGPPPTSSVAANSSPQPKPAPQRAQSSQAAEFFKRLERIEALQVEILKKLDKLERANNR